MQKGIHPDYDYVIFHDSYADESFLIRSTMKSSQTMQWTDGKTYPVVYLDVSSASHPFYTGKQNVNKAEGRVARFNNRFNLKTNSKEATK